MSIVAQVITVFSEALECARCGLSAPVVVKGTEWQDKTYLPKGQESGLYANRWSYPDGWDSVDRKQLCPTCYSFVKAALEKALVLK